MSQNRNVLPIKRRAALSRREPCAKWTNNEAKKRSIKFSLSFELKERQTGDRRGEGCGLCPWLLLPTAGEVKSVHEQRQWRKICAKSVWLIHFCHVCFFPQLTFVTYHKRQTGFWCVCVFAKSRPLS